MKQTKRPKAVLDRLYSIVFEYSDSFSYSYNVLICRLLYGERKKRVSKFCAKLQQNIDTHKLGGAFNTIIKDVLEHLFGDDDGDSD